MQGRLLPKYKKLYQSHPYFNWEKEFKISKKLKLKHIEFIFDNNLPHLNPIMNEKGVAKIIQITKKNRVFVKNLCADYFMEEPLYNTGQNQVNNIETLKVLIENCFRIGVKNIVIPCVDNSSINTNRKKIELLKTINKLGNNLEKKKINLSLEVDLCPIDIRNMLREADLPFLKINYDIGNSASLGYDIEKEFDFYGSSISTIHLKDRILNGGPVLMGKGNSDFFKLFKKIKDINYTGLYTMQVYRDNEGLKIFEKQLKYLKKILKDTNNHDY